MIRHFSGEPLRDTSISFTVRREFVRSSAVFAGMFLLRSGPGANTEGQDGA